MVTGFVVEWQRDLEIGCADENEDAISVGGDFRNYTIIGLEPGNRYTISVRVSNEAGRGPVSNQVTVMTPETGKEEPVPFFYLIFC